MRWVLITPLGSLVEPEVNRNLAIVSGPTLACAASTAAVGSVASSSANDVVARPSIAPSVSTTGVSAGTTAAIALAYAGPLANTRPGVSWPRMWRSLPKSCEISEYAGEIGAYGTPASIAPSASSRCSMSLSERIATGRSAERPRSSSACAIERALFQGSA